MVINKCSKAAFSVIGKKGSTADGEKFITALWEKANRDISEVMPLAKRSRQGLMISCWGLRSDSSMNFGEWENDTDGLYLAGVEVKDDALAPFGWTKWTIPASNYVYIKVDGKQKAAVREAREYIEKKGLEITGAYHEYMNPMEPGQLYLFFPVKDKEKFVFPAPNQK